MSIDKNGVSKGTQQDLSRLHDAIKELLADIEVILDRMPKLPPIERFITVDTTPNFTPLPRQGYRKSLLLILEPVQLIFNTPGIGQCKFNALKRGWLDVSLPDGSSVALASKQSIRLLYHIHD